MKKKIALVLAAVMTFAAAVPMNLFASSSNTVSNQIRNYDDGKILVGNPAVKQNDATVVKGNSMFDGVANNGDSSALRLNFQEDDFAVNADRSFRINLTGAEWAFVKANSPIFTASPDTMAAADKNVTYDTTKANALVTDPDNGKVYKLEVLPQNGSDPVNLNYGKSVGYTITISKNNPSSALIEYNTGDGTVIKKANNNYIEVPLVIKTTTDGELKYTITDNLSNVSSQTDVVFSARSSGTSTTAKSIAEGRNGVELDSILVKELSKNVLATGSNKAFRLVAPNGYMFNKDKAVLEADAAKIVPVASTTENPVRGIFEYGRDSKGNIDRTVLIVTPYITDRTNLVVLYIKKLSLVPIDDVMEYNTDLSIDVKNGDGTSNNDATKIGITEETVKVAKFVSWAVEVTATDAKDIYAGFVEKEAATVTVKELSANSWWLDNISSLTLTDKDGNTLNDVKISKVSAEFTNLINTTKFEGVNNDNNTSTNLKQYYSKDGHSLVLSDNGVPINESTNTRTKLAKAVVKFFISADVNFTGEVYVQVSSNSVYGGSENMKNGGRVLIANIKPLITVDTKTTDVQIGYQRYNVADITITENSKGALEKNKFIELSIGSYNISKSPVNHVLFVPIKADQLSTTGDIKVSVVNTTSASSVITLKVEKTSTTVSSITLKNLQLNLDRTVPFGTFELNVDGDAIRTNYITDRRPTGSTLRDYFDTNGYVVAKYINVVTEGINTAFKNEIKIYSNSKDIVVEGVAQTMGVATINKDGRLYVPIRFVAEYLGATGENDIQWNDADRTAKITLNNKTVTFVQNSEKYYVSGETLPTTMVQDGVISKAFISEGRVYIPYRYLAYAFNIPVTYDDATGAAIYNQKVQ